MNFFDRLGRGGDARLARGAFLQDRDAHGRGRAGQEINTMTRIVISSDHRQRPFDQADEPAVSLLVCLHVVRGLRHAEAPWSRVRRLLYPPGRERSSPS
jgi:hypothetical protein